MKTYAELMEEEIVVGRKLVGAMGTPGEIVDVADRFVTVEWNNGKCSYLDKDCDYPKIIVVE
ncbi:MAG: hypothetical protein WC511_02405 [Candidatus Pacearchaeota archaeon]